MSETESRAPAEWFAGAERDLKSAQALLTGNDELLGAVGIFLYQAAQKYLTGYLLARGGTLRQTEELFELLEAVIAQDPDFADFATVCVQITDFYFEHRSPTRGFTGAARAELEPLFVEAERLIARIQSRIAAPPA